MMAFLILTSLFSFAVFDGLVSDPVDPCGLIRTPSQNQQDRQALIDATLRQTPFAACQNAQDFAHIPERTAFGMSIPSQEKETSRSPNGRSHIPRTTKQMLLKMYDFVIAALEKDIYTTEILETCMSKSLSNSDQQSCQESGVYELVEREFAFQSRQARYSLAMGASVKADSMALMSINSQMQLPSEVFKQEPWLPLSQEERKTAAQDLETYKTEIRSFYKKYPKATEVHYRGADGRPREIQIPPNTPGERYNALLGELRKAKVAHLQAYELIMNRFPVLQFVRSSLTPRPDLDLSARARWTKEEQRQWERFEQSQQEIKRAMQKTKELRLKQVAELKSIHSELFNTTGEEFKGKALNILDEWRPHIQQYLAQNPKDCGLATSIVIQGNKRELAGNLAIAVPLIGASILLPPLATASFGISGGLVATGALATGMGALSYESYQKAEQDLESARARVGGAATNAARDGRGNLTVDDTAVEQSRLYLRDAFSKEHQRDVAVVMLAVDVLPIAAIGLKQTFRGVRLTSSTRVDLQKLQTLPRQFFAPEDIQ